MNKELRRYKNKPVALQLVVKKYDYTATLR